MSDPPATGFSQLARLPPIVLPSSLDLPSEASIFMFDTFLSLIVHFSRFFLICLGFFRQPNTLHMILSPLTVVFSPGTLGFLLIQLIELFFTSMTAKGSSSTHSEVILTPNEYKEYLHLTQVAKFESMSSVAHTGNVSTCFSHSCRP